MWRMKYLNRVTILFLIISFSGFSLSCEQIDSKRLAEVRKAFAEISDENNLAVNMNSHALDLFFRDKERYKDVINELFLFSAHLGDRRGQFNLGRKIYEGNDIENDKDKGLCWLKKSAEQDTPQALFYLGNVYVSKKEDKEIKKGNEYFSRAEKMGYSPALCSLGLSYLSGIGLEKDSSSFQAVSLSSKAKLRLFSKRTAVPWGKSFR